METTSIVWIILGGAIVTIVARLSFLAPIVSYERLPPTVRTGLRFVPPAVLSAIITSVLVQPDELGQIILINPRMIAAAIAAIVAWRFHNTWLTLGVGMIALWILTL